MSTRYRPHVDVRTMSPNKSSRNGVRPRAIVVHSTEGPNVRGLGDLIGLGSWFQSAPVSSHVATDGEGHSARFVRDSDKAWHCGGYNSLTLGIEQVGRASQPSWPDAQERETARWIAYWSKVHGIPVQKGHVAGGRVVVPGVVRHSDLGVIGGNHNDPGRGYDLAHVLVLARAYRKRY